MAKSMLAFSRVQEYRKGGSYALFVHLGRTPAGVLCNAHQEDILALEGFGMNSIELYEGFKVYCLMTSCIHYYTL